MKKLFLLPIAFLMAFGVSSCEDDSTNPLPEKVAGQYMKLDIETREMDFDELSTTAFTGILSNPSGNVVKYDLYVRRRDPSQFLTGDYVYMQSITTFPYNLRITPQMVATALGLNVSDLQDGDVYTFFAYSYDASGHKAGYMNLARINQITASMEQGYKFNTRLFNTPIPLDAEVPYNNHEANP
ncbi:hypothetical protein [Flavobacterium sp.]|uniref:hypothetical protein n=1 Tax=Flavobacterium sp. TaxID=239 RepID=UPI0039E2CAB1